MIRMNGDTLEVGNGTTGAHDGETDHRPVGLPRAEEGAAGSGILGFAKAETPQPPDRFEGGPVDGNGTAPVAGALLLDRMGRLLERLEETDTGENQLDSRGPSRSPRPGERSRRRRRLL